MGSPKGRQPFVVRWRCTFFCCLALAGQGTGCFCDSFVGLAPIEPFGGLVLCGHSLGPLTSVCLLSARVDRRRGRTVVDGLNLGNGHPERGRAGGTSKDEPWSPWVEEQPSAQV